MVFEIFKELTQARTLIFLAFIALLTGFGFHFAVGAGVLSVAILSAAAPVLLGLFLGLMLAAVVFAVIWSIDYFYHDYQREKLLDEGMREVLHNLLDSECFNGEEVADEIEENIGISDHPIVRLANNFVDTLRRGYKVNSWKELSLDKVKEIIGTDFSYRNVFFHTCRDWCIAHKKEIIITSVLLSILLITLIILTSLFFAGVPLPFFIGAAMSSLVGFFEAGFVGLGWVAASALAVHNLLSTIVAGIVFCLAPVSIASTFQRFGGLLHDAFLAIIDSIEKRQSANNSEDNEEWLPTSQMPDGEKEIETLSFPEESSSSRLEDFLSTYQKNSGNGKNSLHNYFFSKFPVNSYN